MRRGASGALSESSQDKSGPVDGGDLAGFLHTRQCDRGMPKTPLSIVLKALCYSKVRQALGAADHGTDGGSNCTGTSFCTSEIPIIKPSTRKDRYSFTAWRANGRRTRVQIHAGGQLYSYRRQKGRGKFVRAAVPTPCWIGSVRPRLRWDTATSAGRISHGQVRIRGRGEERRRLAREAALLVSCLPT